MDDVHCAQQVPGSSNPTTASCTVALITEIENSPDDSLSRDIDNADANFIAAMFDNLNGTSVIGNGSFSDGDLSVRPHFKSKHFVWQCMIDGPAVEFPMKVTSLIDNSSHMVLIWLQLVKKLALPIFTLPNPEIINVVITTTKKKAISLTLYVKIWATSTDGQWTSWVVYVIIAPGLCMPIIFGLPFLEINTIICDHKERACIDKKTNYNLLHPEPCKQLPEPRLPLKQQLKINKPLKAHALNNP